MYKQVVSAMQEVTIIKRSQFITSLVPVETADDAERELNILRKKYSDATHNCYAYIVNTDQQIARFSDDGEPQGTAGIPILEVLRKRNINKTLAVVTRYFGGIKLGSGGLVSAYSNSVSAAMDKACVMEFHESAILVVDVDYNIIKMLIELVVALGKVINISYEQTVVVTFALPIASSERVEADIVEMTLGRAVIKHLPSAYIGYSTIDKQTEINN